MADSILSNLTAASALTGAELFYAVQGGLDRKVTATQIQTFAGVAGNPTASVGLTAVNGSATSFMRSDGAPALSQSIAPTWTGVHIWSVNGALSAPGLSATGTWITGGSATTTKPYVLIEPTGTTSTGWSTSGTGLGVNAASGFVGNLADFQLAGVTKASVSSGGNGVFVGTVTASGGGGSSKGFVSGGVSVIQGSGSTTYLQNGSYSSANGIAFDTNNFGIRNDVALAWYNTDPSGTADTKLSRFGVGTLGLSDSTTITEWQQYATTDSITSPTNYARAFSRFSNNGAAADTWAIGAEKGGTGTSPSKWSLSLAGTVIFDYGVSVASTFQFRAANINWGANSALFSQFGDVQMGAGRNLTWSGSSFIKATTDSTILLQNNAQNNFNLLQFGGTSSSFPALKRSSATLQVRLADDSADAALTIGGLTNSGTEVISNTTDSTTTTSGALQVAGGAAIRKRVFIDGIATSAGLQTAVLCQSSAGEMIADSVACLASSARFKELLGNAETGALAKIVRVPVQKWKYRRDPDSVFPDNYYSEHIGPTAEDIEAIDSRLVGRDQEGKARSISTEQLLALTIQAMQEQQAQIEDMKARLAA